MKKIYTLLTVVLLGSAFSFGQSLSLSETDIYVEGLPSEIIKTKVDVMNISGDTVEVKVYRNVTDNLFGSNNYFCWGTNCYPPSVDESPNPETIAPSATNTSFEGDVDPNDYEGDCRITYCFYNVANPSDETCVNVHYHSSSSAQSINENKNVSTIAQASPNPVSDVTFIGYAISKTARSASLEVMNLTGMVVHSQELSLNANGAIVSVSNLESGLYLYSFIVDGETVATKRLVVNR